MNYQLLFSSLLISQEINSKGPSKKDVVNYRWNLNYENQLDQLFCEKGYIVTLKIYYDCEEND